MSCLLIASKPLRKVRLEHQTMPTALHVTPCALRVFITG